MVQLRDQYQAFHLEVKSSIQSLVKLREENTFSREDVAQIKDWGYIDVPKSTGTRPAKSRTTTSSSLSRFFAREIHPRSSTLSATTAAIRSTSGS